MIIFIMDERNPFILLEKYKKKTLSIAKEGCKRVLLGYFV